MSVAAAFKTAGKGVVTWVDRAAITNSVAHKTDGKNFIEKAATLPFTAALDTLNFATGGAVRSAPIGAKFSDMMDQTHKERKAYVAGLTSEKLEEKDAKLDKKFDRLDRKWDKLQASEDKLTEKSVKLNQRIAAAEALYNKNGGKDKDKSDKSAGE